MSGCYALIVAAGSGKRFGGELPKQYAPLGTTTVLAQSAKALLAHPDIDGVRCVINKNDTDLYAKAVSSLDDNDRLLDPVFGGDTRQQSVLGGLESLSAMNPGKVLIHDGARPFVSSEIISNIISALDKNPGAIPTVEVVDTLKRRNGDFIDETVARDNIFRAQTPQGFRFDEIIKAHRDKKKETLTDDASLFEKSGLSVAMVDGSEENFKITTPEDYKRAQSYFSNIGGTMETRTGFGFDVHRFDEGNNIRLCGVDIPFNKSVIGHSDADVGLHALTDAILGAIGEGDIGLHFPPSDPRWKGADSEVFVSLALELLEKRGAKLNNVDVTLVCEEPKIGPHRELMRTRLSGILKITETRVSVKATTTEGLGATGRREGIAAQVVVSVSMPATDK